MKEEAAGVLTHGAHCLAQIKEETTLDEFHDDEDEVLDDATRGFQDLASVTIVVHVDNAVVLHVLEDGDLVVHRED